MALGMISNIQVSADGIWTWNAYPGATEYHYRIGGFVGGFLTSDKERKIDIVSYLKRNGKPSGTYDLELYARNDSTTLTETWTGSYQYTSLGKLAKPSNLRWEGLTLRWDAVPHADFYYVALYRSDDLSEPLFDKVLTRTNSLDLVEKRYDVFIRDGVDYTVEVCARSQTGYENGEPERLGPKKLAGILLYDIPNVQVSADGVLSWDEFEHYTDRIAYYSFKIRSPGSSNGYLISKDKRSFDLYEYVQKYFKSQLPSEGGADFDISLVVVSTPSGYQVPISNVWNGIFTYDPSGSNSWVVSFSANGGAGAMESARVLKNAYYELPESLFTPPSGKTFSHWTVGSGTARYSPGMSVQISGNTTVKANWKAVDYVNARIQGDYLFWDDYFGASWYIIENLKGSSYTNAEVVRSPDGGYDLFAHCVKNKMAAGTYTFRITAVNTKMQPVNANSRWTGTYVYDPEDSGRTAVYFDLNLPSSQTQDVDFPSFMLLKKGETFGELWDDDVWSIYPEGVPGKVFQWWYSTPECTREMWASDRITSIETVYARWLDAISTVGVTVPVPEAWSGECDYDYSGVYLTDDRYYEIDDLAWTTKDGDSFPIFDGVFEEGETYYLWMSLLMDDSDRAFAFSYKQNKPTFDMVVNGNYVDYASPGGDPTGSVYVQVPVTVRSTVHVNAVTLNVTSLELVVGKTFQLIPTVFPEDAENKEITWVYPQPKIVVGDENGLIRGVKAGRGTAAALSAEDMNYYAECEVFVLFKDVAKHADYFFHPVYWALDEGITTGYTGSKEGYFGPNDECTRAQIVTFLWRAAGSPVRDPGDLSFTDVKPTDYFYNAVIWAAQVGLTTGYTDKYGNPTGVFGSNDTCTRAQIVTFMWRAADCPIVPEDELTEFTDVKPTDYFYKAVMWAARFGITTGYTDSHGNPTGKFGSNDGCTRGQVVTFLYRAEQLV